MASKTLKPLLDQKLLNKFNQNSHLKNEQNIDRVSSKKKMDKTHLKKRKLTFQDKMFNTNFKCVI